MLKDFADHTTAGKTNLTGIYYGFETPDGTPQYISVHGLEFNKDGTVSGEIVGMEFQEWERYSKTGQLKYFTGRLGNQTLDLNMQDGSYPHTGLVEKAYGISPGEASKIRFQKDSEDNEKGTLISLAGLSAWSAGPAMEYVGKGLLTLGSKSPLLGKIVLNLDKVGIGVIGGTNIAGAAKSYQEGQTGEAATQFYFGLYNLSFMYPHFASSGNSSVSKTSIFSTENPNINRGKLNFDYVNFQQGQQASTGLSPILRETTINNPGSLSWIAESSIKTSLNVSGKNQNVTENSTINHSLSSKVEEIEKANLPNWLVNSFKNGDYRTVITKEPITVYRTFGYNSDAGGAFATTNKATSRIDAKIDFALLPEWKNSRKYEAEILIPKNQIINIGSVESQEIKSTGTVLHGGYDQVLLPDKWSLYWIKKITNVPIKK